MTARILLAGQCVRHLTATVDTLSRKVFPTEKLRVVATAAMSLLFVPAATMAGPPSPAPQVIIACYNRVTGSARIVNSVAECRPGESYVTWNIAGPAGPQGSQGPAGPAGPQGSPGTVPANLTALSGALSNNNGVSLTGAATFISAACNYMDIGDVYLSVNGYGQGALPADGRLLTISSNTALFSVIGIDFGGDGTNNFALPDLRPFAPKGLQYSICVSGIFPARL